LRLPVPADVARLDTFLREKLHGFSRTHIQKIIKSSEVTVNGEQAKASRGLREGDTVVVVVPPPEPSDILPEDIPLDILYEDDSIIVVNKQKDLTVHPTPNRTAGTLVNALMKHCGDSLSGIGGVMRPGIVHRLDRETSGVMVAAKNDAAHHSLSDQMKNRTVGKYYAAIVQGEIELLEGEIDLPIGRNPSNRKKMAVVEKGKSALTEYHVAERFEHFTLLDVRLHTGRTHQIRVHMAHIGHPVAGDRVYGGVRFRYSSGTGTNFREDMQAAIDRLDGQALHARELRIRHPMNGRPMRFEAPMPPDMKEFYNFLVGNDAPC